MCFHQPDFQSLMINFTTTRIKNTRISPFGFPTSKQDFFLNLLHTYDNNKIRAHKFDLFNKLNDWQKKYVINPTTKIITNSFLFSLFKIISVEFWMGPHFKDLMREFSLWSSVSYETIPHRNCQYDNLKLYRMVLRTNIQIIWLR